MVQEKILNTFIRETYQEKRRKPGWMGKGTETGGDSERGEVRLSGDRVGSASFLNRTSSQRLCRHTCEERVTDVLKHVFNKGARPRTVASSGTVHSLHGPGSSDDRSLSLVAGKSDQHPPSLPGRFSNFEMCRNRAISTFSKVPWLFLDANPPVPGPTLSHRNSTPFTGAASISGSSDACPSTVWPAVGSAAVWHLSFLPLFGWLHPSLGTVLPTGTTASPGHPFAERPTDKRPPRVSQPLGAKEALASLTERGSFLPAPHVSLFSSYQSSKLPDVG